MNFSQLIAILRARWRVVLSIICLALGTTILLNILLPKRYTATAKVMIDVKSPDPVAGMVLPGMLSPTYLATQGDVINSGRVVDRVISDLGLDRSPQMQKAWQELTEGDDIPFMVWLRGRLSTSLKAKPTRESNVIEIDYTADTAEGAAVLANAFTQAYISITAELRTDPAKEFGSRFELLADQLRKRLMDAQSKLNNFQREAGLMATDEKLDIETDKLSQLSAQVTQLSAFLEDAKAKKQSIQKNGAGTSNEGMANSVVSTVRNDLISQQAKLSQLLERYGDMHPTVKETRKVIAELKSRLEIEYGQTGQLIGVNSNIVAERLAAAKSALELQKQKLIDLRGKRAGASVLMRDVENIQRAYDVVQSRASQAGIETQVASTSLAILEKAIAPTKPSSPRSVLNTIIALTLGTLLAVVIALLLEMMDPRVRTNEDIQNQLKLPLMGVLLKTENVPHSRLGRKNPPWLIHRNKSLPTTIST